MEGKHTLISSSHLKPPLTLAVCVGSLDPPPPILQLLSTSNAKAASSGSSLAPSALLKRVR